MRPRWATSLSRQTFDGDFRYYQRIATNGVAAFRFRGYNSTGDTPDYFYYGGNSELRGYDYLQFVGNKGFFANAELRFPLIEAMLTPIGVLGGVQGRGLRRHRRVEPVRTPDDHGLQHGPVPT